jgi:hypothetical protein
MCTVSIVRAPWSDEPREAAAPLWRVMCNRDERRDRLPAAPPFVAGCARHRAVHPIDPEGRGTWIAATTAGLVFVLLNEIGPPDATRRERLLSRGLVIPVLASARTLEEVAARLARLPPGRYRPFLLLAASDDGLVEAVAGQSMAIDLRAPAPTIARTSSSQQPSEVRQRRMALFDELVPGPSLAAQGRFHEHRWPDAPGASVCMSRLEARTVSITTVDVFARCVRLSYRPLPGRRADVTEVARPA